MQYLSASFIDQYVIMLQKYSKILILSCLCSHCCRISRPLQIFCPAVFCPEIFFRHLKVEEIYKIPRYLTTLISFHLAKELSRAFDFRSYTSYLAWYKVQKCTKNSRLFNKNLKDPKKKKTLVKQIAIYWKPHKAANMPEDFQMHSTLQS